jgi:hypothetical protein
MLHLAAGRGEALIVKWLIDHGKDVNASAHGDPPPKRHVSGSVATRLDSTRPCRYRPRGPGLQLATILLAAGARLNVRDDLLKSTPLVWASGGDASRS